MKARAAFFGALIVLVVIAIWLRSSEPIAPVPETAVQSAPPFEVAGVVRDADGSPIEGAKVQLFSGASTWTDDTFSLSGRPSDEGRECDRWPMACHADVNRDEAWKRFDAGTLEYPVSIVETLTDAEGRFVLRSPHHDTFLVASRGLAFALVDSTLGPFADESITLTQSEPPDVDSPFTIINPFTKTSAHVNPGDALTVPMAGAVLWFDDAEAPRVETSVSLEFDGGLVAGVLEIDCGPDHAFTFHTDGGVVTFSRPARACPLWARAEAGFQRTWLLKHTTVDVVELQARRPLTVKWEPASGATRVTVRYPPTGGIGDLGTRGGGFTPGVGTFDGGVAHFDTLQIKPDVDSLEVLVDQPGFIRSKQRFDPTRTQELTLRMIAAPGTTGQLIDTEGRAVARQRVTASTIDGGYLDWTMTDDDGRFSFSPANGDAFVMTAFDPLRGMLSLRTDAHDGGRLMLSHGDAVDIALGGNANERVTVKIWDDEFRLRTNDAGVLRLTGLPVGALTIVISTDDGGSEPVDLVVK